MLSLSNDLLSYILLSLHPSDLCATLTACQRIFNLIDQSEDRFYRDYWKYQCRECKTLVNYKLAPKWRYGSYRTLVATQILRVLPLIKLIKYLEVSPENVVLSFHQGNNCGKSSEWIGSLYREDGITKTGGTRSKDIIEHPQLSMAEALVDIFVNGGNLIYRDRKRSKVKPINFDDANETNLYVKHERKDTCSFMIIFSRRSSDILEKEDGCPACQNNLFD